MGGGAIMYKFCPNCREPVSANSPAGCIKCNIDFSTENSQLPKNQTHASQEQLISVKLVAESTADKHSMVALTRVANKNMSVRKVIVLVCDLVLLAIAIFSLVGYFTFSDRDTILLALGLVCLFLAVISFFAWCLMSLFSIKNAYKQNEHKMFLMSYRFTENSYFLNVTQTYNNAVVSVNPIHSCNLASLRRIIETPDYFFLFETYSTAAIISKQALQHATPDQIRDFLQKRISAKKYKIMNK